LNDIEILLFFQITGKFDHFLTEQLLNEIDAVIARRNDEAIIVVPTGDYKLHPCNLPCGPHFVRSILLRAK
jgi:hypothetical protein